jgi:hypothetical protein
MYGSDDDEFTNVFANEYANDFGTVGWCGILVCLGRAISNGIHGWSDKYIHHRSERGSDCSGN